MRFWSDSEVELLIDEISEAAIEAVEKAAGEAAKAAVLTMVEREAEILRELQTVKNEAAALKKSRITTAVITGVICLLSGFTTGAILIGVKK